MKVKPILKWAGGKTQLLSNLRCHLPSSYEKYIEPFVGGGALFFDLEPENAIISDSNPELINMYKVIANSPNDLIESLKLYKNTEEDYYRVRELDVGSLSEVERASRTIYLNHTCFNGLYRVNKKGQFNVPFGNYKNPKIVDEELITSMSEVLKNTTIILGDYLDVLSKYAEKGDLIFLDPPYVPVGKWGDFKRYTKEQFYEEDQINLSKEVKRLTDLGAYVILTNSDHPLVLDLYKDYNIESIPTKRNISSNGNTRKGVDVIVTNY